MKNDNRTTIVDISVSDLSLICGGTCKCTADVCYSVLGLTIYCKQALNFDSPDWAACLAASVAIDVHGQFYTAICQTLIADNFCSIDVAHTACVNGASSGAARSH